MLHPSWRSALRRLAGKLAGQTRARRRSSLGTISPLEERLAPAFLSSQLPFQAPTTQKVRVMSASPVLSAPSMPGVNALPPGLAGAVLQAWEVPTTAVTSQWVIGMAAGQDPRSVVGPDAEITATGFIPDTYVVKFASEQLVSEIGDRFDGSAFYYPLVAHQHSAKFVPNDPLFKNQWHLRNTGQQGGLIGADVRVVPVWDNYKGSGVLIGIVDDGLQHSHPDLQPNYVAAHSFDFNDNDSDPNPATGDDHGTAVGGVAAAVGNNKLGVTGAAMAASLAGLRLLGGATTDQTDANALSFHRDDIDIYNNSWGPIDSGTLGPIGPLTLAAIQQGVALGRGGLGNIFTWAAGNGLGNDDNVNYDGYANSRFVIAVGAIDHQGKQASYSEPGAAMLVTTHSMTFTGNAPGITTTDLVGSDGADPGDYRDDFNGTSSSTPLASGVIALMLEANPDLTWRDVQHILVRSARKTDPTDAGWSTNKGGLPINHKYGFGAVDANKAVALAEAWTNVKPEMKIQMPVTNVNKAIPDTGVAVSSSVTVAQNIKVEHVEVIFDATHTNRGNLEVILTAPSGTRSILAQQHNTDSGDNYTKWMFSTVRNWNELSGGKWTLSVRDRVTGETGTFNNWQLQVYGTEGIPPVLSGIEASGATVLENKQVRVTSTLAVSDPNSPSLSGGKVSISGNFISGEDVLTFTPAGAISGNYDEGSGILTLTGSGTISQYQSVLRSVKYENTSDDPITLPRTIAFQVTDETATASNVVTRGVTVIAVNDPPTFTSGGNVTVPEDAGPQQFENWATGITPGPETDQTVSIEIVSNSNPGLLVGAPFVTDTGTLLFTPAPNANGSTTIELRARDNGGTANGGKNVSETQSFQIIVTPVNDAPLAKDDEYTVGEEGTLNVIAPGVLGNDQDPEGDSKSATKLTDPVHGTLTFNSDGSFTYVPDADFSGDDTFTYKAADLTLESDPVTVTIHVAPVNDPPVANDDSATSDGSPVTINVLANDTDQDGDVLRVSTYSAPTLGRLSRSGNALIYTPNPGAVGTDSFQYKIIDEGGATDTATVDVVLTDTVAPIVRSVRLDYGSSSSAVIDFGSLSRTVLPWANVTSFSFVFNEGVVIADPNALTITGGTGGTIPLTFNYNTATRTATWTAPTPLPIDRYNLRLDGAGVVDAAGNALSSDWAKAFAVLPGDFDGNGVVDSVDLSGIKANYTALGRPLNRWADVNGSGAVDAADLDIATNNLGKRV